MDTETKQQIIDMYLAVGTDGRPQHSVAAITDATGVARSSIYYILDAAGIPLNRTRKQSDSELAELLRESQEQILQLKAQVRSQADDLERARRVIDTLTQQASSS